MAGKRIRAYWPQRRATSRANGAPVVADWIPSLSRSSESSVDLVAVLRVVVPLWVVAQVVVAWL